MNDNNADGVREAEVEPMPGNQPGSSEPAREIPVHPGFDPKDIEDNKFVAALSYIGILFLVPLLVKRESPFSQFHAKQGLVLAIIFFVGSFVFWVPLIGWAAFLLVLVVDIMALIKTLQGQAWEIPVIKDIVKKLNI